jgi:hypothetical protein
MAGNDADQPGETRLTPQQLAILNSGDRARINLALRVMSRSALSEYLGSTAAEPGLHRTIVALAAGYHRGTVTGPAVVRLRIIRCPARYLEADLVIEAERCYPRAVDPATEPTTTVSMDARGFVEITCGIQHPADLVRQRRLHVHGNIRLAQTLGSMFTEYQTQNPA